MKDKNISIPGEVFNDAFNNHNAQIFPLPKSDIDSIKDRLAEIENEKRELEAKLRIEENLTPEKKLAVYLHEKFCAANHTDGCGWFYEKGNDIWNGHMHSYWLKEAKILIIFLKKINFVQVFKDLK